MPDGSAKMNRRVLMIAHEFPPIAAGGVVRSLKFARYLPRCGWQPHVLTVRNPDWPSHDASVLDQLDRQVCIHRTRTWESHVPREALVRLGSALGLDSNRLRGALEWRLGAIYRQLAIPDQRVFWALPAVITGLGVMLRHRIDAIYSTSWPYSDHIAGWLLSKLTGRPLIADLRDPWTQHLNYRARDRGWDRMQRKLERAVCRQARFVIAPALKSTQMMRRLMGDMPGKKFVTIRNGYDPADFVGTVEPSGTFDVVHAGTFYKSRQPDALLEGLERFLRRVPQAQQHTRVRLFGMSLDSDLTRCRGRRCVELHGWTAHKKVIEVYRRSSVLLLLRHFEGTPEITLPGKVFEYMATGNHILAVQAPQRELDGILKAYGQATVLRKNDPELLAAALEQLYRRWRRGDLAAVPPPAVVERFNRVALTGQLADLLHRAVGLKPMPATKHRALQAFFQTPNSLLATRNSLFASDNHSPI
ncbi:MAG: glycosyltransferase [Phycisphaerae bacterium]